MDLKSFKKAVLFAKKQGLRAVTWDGVAFEFFPDAMRAVSPARLKAVPKAEESKMPAMPPAPPTLDDINQFIYGQTEDSA